MSPLLRRPRAVLAAAAMVCAAATLVTPCAASAQVTAGPSNTIVTGAATDTLAIAASAASTLAPITAGSTASGTGTVTIISTSGGNWTLDANDANTGANAGKPALTVAAGCSGSAAYLPTLGVTATGTGVTSAGLIPLSANATQIATGPSSSGIVTTAFSDVIPAGTALTAGCVYTLTSVFTASAP